MEALAVLRLSVALRRHNHGSQRFLEDDDETTLPTPYTSAPSSPRRAFAKEVEEAPLGEVLAAVPFAWELIPGTPKEDLDSIEEHLPELSLSSDELTESSQDHGSSSTSSSTTSEESLSRESSNAEFEFSCRLGATETEPAQALPWPPTPSMSTADELFSNGQLVTSTSTSTGISRLRLPPRLQAAKLNHLRSSDSSSFSFGSDGSSSSGSLQSPQSPDSPRPKLSLCGFTATADEETTILGMQPERKQNRSLSPLRFFQRECLASFFSSDSNSSISSSRTSSSSSASGGETNANSPGQVSVLKQGLVTDMAMASGSIEDLPREKVIAKPKLVQSKLEQLNAEKGDVSRALSPQLSRSNARSRPAPTPAIDIRVNSLRKVNTGRAMTSASRFGMLCTCLGMLPDSP